MDERYLKQLGKMKRPIPGMSLTNDPNNPAPFEGPPEFTKKKDALEYLFSGMIDEEVYPQLIENLAVGVPVTNVTQMLLYEGFREGKWNPDLFTLLIEPTMYMVMALAERAGVDYVIDNEPEEEDAQASEVKNRFDSITKGMTKVKAGVLPAEIEKQIEELPAESLLAKPMTEEQEEIIEETPESLITRPR